MCIRDRAAITFPVEMTQSLCSIFPRWGESTSLGYCLVVDSFINTFLVADVIKEMCIRDSDTTYLI